MSDFRNIRINAGSADGPPFLELAEASTAPDAPNANALRLYARDTGGATEIVALNSAGSIAAIPIVPLIGTAIASAATISVSPGPYAYHVTGTTTIKNITITGSVSFVGPLYLIADAAWTVNGSAGNIRLAGGQTSRAMIANEVLALVYDSDNALWYELSSSVAAASPQAGGLNVFNNGVAQTLNGTAGKFDKLTAFDTALPTQGGITVDTTNKRLTATLAGTYVVSACLSFAGSGNADMEIGVWKNSNVSVDMAAGTGSRINACTFERKIGAGGDIGAASFCSLVALSANDYIELAAASDGNSDSMTLKNGTFMIFASDV